uniref:Uncharacterized protein n=1 Tax=Moniliophthora roreri TaxID=221103 RepID=A0A0W0GA44_MONRR
MEALIKLLGSETNRAKKAEILEELFAKAGTTTPLVVKDTCGERLLQRKVQTLTTDKTEKAELAANLRSCTWMRQKPSQKAMNGLVSRSGFPYSNMMAAAAPVSSNPTVMERLRAVVPKTIEDMEVLAVRNG